MIKNDNNYIYADLTEKIIGQVYSVYNTLGYGFLEKVYVNSLIKKLKDIGFKVEKEYPIKVLFENEVVGDYFADIIVDDKIILEIKAIESLNQVHEVQLVNYLKATGIQVGLLVNFGKRLEIKRRVLSSDHAVEINHKQSA